MGPSDDGVLALRGANANIPSDTVRGSFVRLMRKDGGMRAALRTIEFQPEPSTLSGDRADFSFIARLILKYKLRLTFSSSKLTGWPDATNQVVPIATRTAQRNMPYPKSLVDVHQVPLDPLAECRLNRVGCIQVRRFCIGNPYIHACRIITRRHKRNNPID